MINLNEIITEGRALMNRSITREGFVFTSITHPANVFDAIVIRSPDGALCDSLKLGLSERSFEEHVDFINRHKIEKALIIAENIEFIVKCPSLNCLRIIPADSACDGFDYSPLYKMPLIKGLQCMTEYGSKGFSSTVDCSKIAGLESIHVTNKHYANFNRIPSIKNLGISNYAESDLSEAFEGKELDTLSVFQSRIKTLAGVERSERLQCLYLHYNRSLEDISALSAVKHTLKALRIESCPKITDFSVLRELANLQLLELSGSNELPDLGFLRDMRSLKTFVFSMNVKNGDLLPCRKLSYVYCAKNRKHYNLKDSQLPKGEYIRGNEDIEPWRRQE